MLPRTEREEKREDIDNHRSDDLRSGIYKRACNFRCKKFSPSKIVCRAKKHVGGLYGNPQHVEFRPSRD